MSVTSNVVSGPGPGAPPWPSVRLWHRRRLSSTTAVIAASRNAATTGRTVAAATLSAAKELLLPLLGGGGVSGAIKERPSVGSTQLMALPQG